MGMIIRGYPTTATTAARSWIGPSLLIALIALAVTKRVVEALAQNDRTLHPHSPVPSRRRTPSPLEGTLAEYASTGRPTLLIVDTNNVRGKDDFATWNSDLLPRLASLRHQYATDAAQLHILYAMDHGSRPQVFDYEDGLIVFAGPHRTADDVIAQAVRFFADGNEQGCQVVAVTSDGELKQRCLRRGGDYKRKKDKSLPIKVVGSPSLVSTLKNMGESEISISKNFLTQLERIESDIRWCTALHPPFQTGAAKAEAQAHGPWTSDLFETKPSHEIFPRKLFSELTWHRVLVAEAMRQLLDAQPPCTTSSVPRKELTSYKVFYENHQMDNSSGAAVNTMFLDHRLRRDPYLQQQLLNYFQTTLSSSLVGQESTALGSPSDLAVEFMVALVEESPTKTHDELLTRYMNEAPNYLQSSRKVDLSNLLKQLAVREKRNGDTKPKWYVREDIDPDSLGFQPRRGRRSQKRQQSSLAVDEMDEELLEAGRLAEMEWMQKWNEQRLANCES
jgi:hypothetical protein